MEANYSITLTGVVYQDKVTGKFTGTVKEIEGIVIQANSAEEVVSRFPRAIKALLMAKTKRQTSLDRREDANFVTQTQFQYDLG